MVFALVTTLIHSGHPDADIVALLLNRDWKISDHIYDGKTDGQAATYARKQVANAHRKAGGRIFSKDTPLKTAKLLMSDVFTAHGKPILHQWNGEAHVWASTHYADVEPAAIKSHVQRYLEKARRAVPPINKIPQPPVPFDPTP